MRASDVRHRNDSRRCRGRRDRAAAVGEDREVRGQRQRDMRPGIAAVDRVARERFDVRRFAADAVRAKGVDGDQEDRRMLLAACAAEEEKNRDQGSKFRPLHSWTTGQSLTRDPRSYSLSINRLTAKGVLVQRLRYRAPKPGEQ